MYCACQAAPNVLRVINGKGEQGDLDACTEVAPSTLPHAHWFHLFLSGGGGGVSFGTA
jgi:hypothetical protein